jgi:hypothetical protein
MIRQYGKLFTPEEKGVKFFDFLVFSLHSSLFRSNQMGSKPVAFRGNHLGPGSFSVLGSRC